MKNSQTMKRWQRAFLVFILVVGSAVGVAAGNNIYRAGRGWLAALFVGIFCGGLAGIGTLVFVPGVFRFVGTLLYLRRTKTKLCGLVPEWLFLGVFGLLMFGGAIVLGAGALIRSRVCRAAGGLALITGFGIIALLVLAGFCRVGWRKCARKD